MGTGERRGSILIRSRHSNQPSPRLNCPLSAGTYYEGVRSIECDQPVEGPSYSAGYEFYDYGELAIRIVLDTLLLYLPHEIVGLPL